MDAILEVAFSFPVVILTAINLIIVGLWGLMAIGLFDFELFDVDIDVEIDADTSLSGIASLLVTLGLSGVPIFIVLTLLFFTAWLIAYFFMRFGMFWNTSDIIQLVVGIGVLLGSFAASIPIAAQVVKPLRKFFAKLNATTTSNSILGKQAIIRTTRVSQSFGEAECVNDGASLILKVRADESYHLTKGDLVRVIEVEKETGIYHVVPEKEFSTENI